MKENNKMNVSRRRFLKTAALAGAAMAMRKRGKQKYQV